MNEYLAGLSVVVIILIVIGYFLPTIIALMRGKSNFFAIFLLNLFLGWSFVGWIISLVWACTNDTQKQNVIVNNYSSPVSASGQLLSVGQNEIKTTKNDTKSLNDLYRKNALGQNSQGSKIDELKELKILLDTGILTTEEFEIEKRKILNS